MRLKLDQWSWILHAFEGEIEIGPTDDSFRGIAVVIWDVTKTWMIKKSYCLW